MNIRTQLKQSREKPNGAARTESRIPRAVVSHAARREREIMLMGGQATHLCWLAVERLPRAGYAPGRHGDCPSEVLPANPAPDSSLPLLLHVLWWGGGAMLTCGSPRTGRGKTLDGGGMELWSRDGGGGSAIP